MNQTPIHRVNQLPKGSFKSTLEKEYQIRELIFAAKHNFTTIYIYRITKDWVNKYSGCSLGRICDFVSITAEALREDIIDRIWKVFSRGGIYNEFSFTFNGTPYFAEAEAVIVRTVTKYWNITELDVLCDFYKKDINSG